MFGFFGWLWNTVATPVINVVATVVETVVEVVATVVETVVDVTTNVVTDVAHFVLDPIGLGAVAHTLDVAEAIIDNAATLAGDAVEVVADAATELLNTASNVVGHAVSLDVGGVVSDAGEVLNTADQIIGDTSDALTDLYYGVGGDTFDIVGSGELGDFIPDATIGLVNGVFQVTDVIIGGVDDAISTPIIGGLGDFLVETGDAVSDLSCWTDFTPWWA